jgi:hypothetical protein
MKKIALLLLAGITFTTSCITEATYTRNQRGEKVWLDQKDPEQGYYTMYHGVQQSRDKNGGVKDYKPKSHMRGDALKN